MTDNVFLKTIKESAGIRLSVLFGSFFVFLLLSGIISGIISNVPAGDERDHSLWSSAVQCILAFCIPAILLARFVSTTPLSWLKLEKPLKIKPIIGVIILYFISLPAMDWLIEWNKGLHLPESMGALEATLRQWEEASESVSNVLLSAKGFLPVFSGVIVIGVLTGFSEELFFRGGLQGILSKGNMGIAVSIWITALIFSTMHFQFFGFVPRLLMGAFFGYLLFWTGDLKISAFAHILNNSIVVIMAGIEGNENLSASELSLIPTLPYLPLVSLVLTVMFFIFCKDFFFRTKSASWQKNQIPQVTER